MRKSQMQFNMKSKSNSFTPASIDYSVGLRFLCGIISGGIISSILYTFIQLFEGQFFISAVCILLLIPSIWLLLNKLHSGGIIRLKISFPVILISSCVAGFVAYQVTL
jgi:hypothetical protein